MMAVSSSVFSQLASIRNVVKSGSVTSHLLTRITNRMSNVSLYSTATAAAPEKSEEAPVGRAAPRKMSKAMLAYLERAKAHDIFIQKETEDYKIGKRHLASMMGEDPENFTQMDVERAIEYLFPSGLYDKAARPVMRPPEDIFPPRKAAEFDETGRPFHSMFYTSTPNFFQTLYDIVEQMQNLNALEDKMLRKGVRPDPNNQIDLTASDWVKQKDFEQILLEAVREVDYEYFLSTITRLIEHPYSYHIKDFIMKYRIVRKSHIESLIVPELEYDSDGRPFITVPDCMRKKARGTVTIKGKGTGKIIVNGMPFVNYFHYSQDREQVFTRTTKESLFSALNGIFRRSKTSPVHMLTK